MRVDLTPKEVERFWSKVDRSGGPDACWNWQSSRTPSNYGQFLVWRDGKRRSLVASRVAFELANNAIPDGLNACHNCPDGDNPRCCNPAHLFAGTQKENVRDAMAKGRMVFRGHFGAINGSTKLTDQDVRDIRRLHKEGVAIRELARRYSIARFAVFQVVRRLTWQHVE